MITVCITIPVFLLKEADKIIVNNRTCLWTQDTKQKKHTLKIDSVT